VLRVAAVLLPATTVLVAATGTAHAATSHALVHHEAGNAAGEVWFNSGPHFIDHGYNSFTVKDKLCGDGWGIRVKYSVGGKKWSWTPEVSCDRGGPQERDFTVPGRTDAAPLRWVGCKYDLKHPNRKECFGEADSAEDQVGRADNNCDSTWIARANGTQNTDGASGWTLKIRPTPEALPTIPGQHPGVGARVDAIWRDVQRCVPLPYDLSPSQRDSLHQQLECHAMYDVGGHLAGGTWDLESSRPKLTGKLAKLKYLPNRCNW
jgi:hypothetical protein